MMYNADITRTTAVYKIGATVLLGDILQKNKNLCITASVSAGPSRTHFLWVCAGFAGRADAFCFGGERTMMKT